MVLSELIEEVRSEVRDTDGEWITDIDIVRWLNHAKRDIAQRLKLISHTIVGTCTQTPYIIYPTAESYAQTGDTDGPLLVEIQNLIIGSRSVVEWVDDTEFDKWKLNFVSPAGYYGRVWEDKIEVYPAPGATTAYTLRYYAQPNQYDPDAFVGTEASGIPAEFDTKLVYYACFRAKLKSEELGSADRYQAFYELGLPAHPLGKQRVNPGPINIGFKKGPFDTNDAWHF